MKKRFYRPILATLFFALAGCASPSNDSADVEPVAIVTAPIPTAAPEPTIAPIPIPVATPTPFVPRAAEAVDAAPQSLEEAFPVQEITPDKGNSRRPRAGNSRPQSPRASEPRTQRVEPEPNPVAQSSGQVWVNTNSDVYHMPGMRYYGKTREGYYATEAEAQAAGFRRATR